MLLQLNRLDVDELGYQVKLPPELEVFGCARTKAVEEHISSARTTPLKGVRKEKPHLGALHIRARSKRRDSIVICSPILSEVLSIDQNNIDLNTDTNYLNGSCANVTFSEKYDVLESSICSELHNGKAEVLFTDCLDIVDVGSRRLNKKEKR